MTLHVTTAGVVQRGELGHQHLHVLHVRLADRLDLPLNKMKAPVTARVACVTLQRTMLRMDVEFDAPLHRRHRQVDMHRSAAGSPQDSRLTLNRHAAGA